MILMNSDQNYLLKIQKAVRNLLNKKNFYKNKIIKIIQKERKTKGKKIMNK